MLLLCLLLSGCAGKLFRRFDAATPQDALNEIASRRRMLGNFDGSATLNFELSQGKVSCGSSLELKHSRDWKITLTGAFGVKVAIVETGNGQYRISNLRQGQVESGFLDVPVTIPEIDLGLPSLNILSALLLPVPDIEYPQDWRIEDDGHRGKLLTLVHLRPEFPDSVQIDLSYLPMQIHSETHWRAGELLFRREYVYANPDEDLPKSIAIEIGTARIGIEYGKLNTRDEATPLHERGPM